MMTDKQGKNSKAQKAEQKTPDSVLESYVTKSTFKSDPFGSYTGHPEEKGEKPVQDADDI